MENDFFLKTCIVLAQGRLIKELEEEANCFSYRIEGDESPGEEGIVGCD